MQRLTGTLKSNRRTAGTPARESRSAARPHPAIRRSTSHVLTLAPASSLSLPSLVGTRQCFSYSEDQDALAPVAHALIEHGYASLAMWRRSNGQLHEFVTHGMAALVEANGGDETDDHVDAHASLSSRRRSEYDNDSPDDEKELRFTIEVEACGWFHLGPTLNKLEDIAPGLGAAFYLTLERSLRAFTDIYDYSRAMDARESQLEMIESEGEEESHVDVLDPDRQAPPRVLPRLKKEMAPSTSIRLLKRHRDSKGGKWIRPLLALAELVAGYKPHMGERDLQWDVLPGFLLCFWPNDDINAAFDEYGEYAMQGDIGPCYVRKFNAKDPASTDAALESLAYTTRLYVAASRVQRAIHGKPAQGDPRQ